MVIGALNPREHASSAIGDTLRVLEVDAKDADRLPEGWQSVELSRGKKAILGPLDGWVRDDRVRICVGSRKTACHDVRAPADGRRESLAAWALPRLDEGPIARRDRVTFALPIRITGSDTERMVQLTMFARGRWWIDRITGVDHEIAPDRQRATLRASGSRTGSIVFGYDGSYGDRPYLPSYLETRPEEGAIRSVLHLPPFLRWLCAKVDCQ